MCIKYKTFISSSTLSDLIAKRHHAHVLLSYKKTQALGIGKERSIAGSRRTTRSFYGDKIGKHVTAYTVSVPAITCRLVWCLCRLTLLTGFAATEGTVRVFCYHQHGRAFSRLPLHVIKGEGHVIVRGASGVHVTEGFGRAQKYHPQGQSRAFFINF